MFIYAFYANKPLKKFLTQYSLVLSVFSFRRIRFRNVAPSMTFVLRRKAEGSGSTGWTQSTKPPVSSHQQLRLLSILILSFLFYQAYLLCPLVDIQHNRKLKISAHTHKSA